MFILLNQRQETPTLLCFQTNCKLQTCLAILEIDDIEKVVLYTFIL